MKNIARSMVHAPFFNDVIDIVYNALKEEILNDITLMDDEEIVGLSERYGFFDLDSIVRAMISSRYFEDINFFMEIMEDVTVHLHLTIMLDEDEINRSLGNLQRIKRMLGYHPKEILCWAANQTSKE